MKTRTALFGLLLAGTVISGAAQANLITNGDFSLGNVGFSSQYTYMPTNVTHEGTYTVGTNPYAFHSGGASFGDHTTGAGNMLIANGATTANVTAWQETVKVAVDSDYIFSGWAASWGNFGYNYGYSTDTSPAQLQFYVNGVQIGSEFVVPALNGLWTEFQFHFNSGSFTSVALTIADANMAAAPNDFSLDDLSLSIAPEPTTVPEPTSIMLAALSLIGLMFGRRRKHD